MTKHLRKTILLIVLITLGFIPEVPHEGMYPLTDIPKTELIKAGLKIDPSEIYNPNGISLIDALVKLNGCTGSFVSEDGLILTNHHCAFRAISRASSLENNYLENGFLASDHSKEIPAPGYQCRIIDSYIDVSDLVLNHAKNAKSFHEKDSMIKSLINKIEKENTDSTNSIIAKVSEMFVGQTYILFKYKVLKDIRLVYAPPRSIGEFGGETDNWVWPRHTGDFSFMRAYVSPDGNPAQFNTNNIPYTPKRSLKINANGLKENDFVFILGYPGRTYKQSPAKFIEYQQNYRLPFYADLYEWMINKYIEIGKTDAELNLKFQPTIKSLANTMKRSKGQLLGLKRLLLIEKKFKEEEELKSFINSNSELKQKYGSVFGKLDAAYSKMNKIAEAYLWFNQFQRRSELYRLYTLYQNYFSNDDHAKKESTKNFIESLLDNFNESFEFGLINKFIKLESEFSSNVKITAIERKSILSGFKNSLLKKDDTSFILNKASIETNLSKSFNDLYIQDKLFFNFFEEIETQFALVKEEWQSIQESLNSLIPIMMDAKRIWKGSNFIPDANATLRLTYGNIKGYSPADAVYKKPFTTLNGVIDKSRQGGDYKSTDKLEQLNSKAESLKYYDNNLGGIPVAMLYNTDTSGGNSGSPILNANGELIGLNFDRAYEATINDFTWDYRYSRSIGVDIRYILWVAKYHGGAENILNELGQN